MTDDQPEQPVSRPSYPWYGWLLGIWFLVPLPLMFLGMSSPQARRRLNKWSIIGYSSLIYLALIIGLLIAASAGGSSQGMSSATSPTLLSTPTPIPSPTPTPIPSPTPTPIPSPTPTPVPTVNPCERSDARVYFTRLAGILTPLSDTFAQISALGYKASENPLTLVDPEWQFELALNLGTLQLAADEIRALPAPHEVQLVHGEMMEFAEAMDEGATLYARGVDNIDVELLELAGNRFSEANRLMESFTEKFLVMCR